MRLSVGTNHRLGATWDGRGTNFALFSANAEKVELCLFDSQGRREIERIELPERTEDVWHGYLNDVSPGQVYGYRVHGPYVPERGHRFNANKLLLDPYAKRLANRLVWSDAHFAYRAGSSREDQLGPTGNPPLCLVGRHRHLRSPCERVDTNTSERPPQPARIISRTVIARHDRSLQAPRHHDG